MREIWVDFNSLDKWGELTTPTELPLEIGETVVARDPDGSMCDARVMRRVEPDSVLLALDLTRLTSGVS